MFDNTNVECIEISVLPQTSDFCLSVDADGNGGVADGHHHNRQTPGQHKEINKVDHLLKHINISNKYEPW